MKDMARLLEKWQLNVGDVREQMYRAPTPRERERWHGLWLLVTQVAEALERDSHTIGDWLSGFRRAGAQAPAGMSNGPSISTWYRLRRPAKSPGFGPWFFHPPMVDPQLEEGLLLKHWIR